MPEEQLDRRHGNHGCIRRNLPLGSHHVRFLQGSWRGDGARTRGGTWVPGYYSLSFLDPDAIRLKVNHVPASVS
jgi:hypothetical protein